MPANKEHKLLNLAEAPRWSIIIAVFGRHERLFRTLRCLVRSIRDLNAPAEILLLDNGPGSQLLNELRLFFSNQRLQLNVRYWVLPRLNQSGLRNWGFARLAKTSEFLLIHDSDIYVGPRFFAGLQSFLESSSHLVAVGPPIAQYHGGRISSIRKSFADRVMVGAPGIMLPSREDYEAGRWSTRYLDALMLRGSYALRLRNLRPLVGQRPWNESFNVWQNVPFFLGLREQGQQFGFFLSPELIALHDERPHPDTLRWSMSDFNCETVKSIILLLKRNCLWEERSRALNARFVSVMADRLVEHCGGEVRPLLSFAIEAAFALSLSQRAGIARLRKLQLRCKNHAMRNAIASLTKLNWSAVAKLRSLNLEVPM